MKLQDASQQDLMEMKERVEGKAAIVHNGQAVMKYPTWERKEDRDVFVDFVRKAARAVDPNREDSVGQSRIIMTENRKQAFEKQWEKFLGIAVDIVVLIAFLAGVLGGMVLSTILHTTF